MLSPPPPIKEKTLSYYFHLDHEEISSPPAKPTKFFASSSSSSVFATRNTHTSHRPSCAEPGPWKPLLADSEHATPLSWLSTLFSRRKKKQKSRSAVALAYSSPSVEWEPPRASSWEQLSSWEKPPTSSTWDFPSVEPRRASEACIEDLEAAIAKHGEVNSLMEREGPGADQRRHQRKKWMRSVLAIKWAMKLKRRLMKKRREEAAEEEASAMSTVSSAARGSKYAYHNLQNGRHRCGNGVVYSPLINSYTSEIGGTRWQQRGDAGLLRFYLTPSRKIKIGTTRQSSYHPLILGL